MLSDFFALLYPRNCVACGNSLYKHEEQLCNYCLVHIPKTNFHQRINNPIEKVFYGRVDLALASSFYLFTKKGRVQKILHAIKYKGNKELAVLVGKLYAKDLKENELFKQIDYIIPVPLHGSKLKQRGYNQSEEFAKGIALQSGITINTDVLIRTSATSTQTKKNKFERWENVEDKFELTNLEFFKHKHVLLVDDVITTGATIEACSSILKQTQEITLSVLSIAYADK